MSMLLALAERLRNRANLCTEQQLASELRDAADTICQLRNELVDKKAENARLWRWVRNLRPNDSEGNELAIDDTVHMLQSGDDGDREWDDVVVEMLLAKCGNEDGWIVRGYEGEAWACDCTRSGYGHGAHGHSEAESCIGMGGHGVMELPRDRDGRPIEFGSLVRVAGERFRVTQMRMNDEGTLYVSSEDRSWHRADECVRYELDSIDDIVDSAIYGAISRGEEKHALHTLLRSSERQGEEG